MGALILVVYPVVVLSRTSSINQTIFGNHPMLARWLGAPLPARAEPAFFQDEFAGRVATKVMQTALGGARR